MAESSTFKTTGAIRLLVDRRMMRASLADRPRIKSITSRAFCGDERMYLASALASMSIPIALGGLRRLLRGRFHRVSLERAGRRKLAQLVPHHVLGDVHRNKFLAVVHAQCVPDELRQNRRTARPRANHLLLVLLVHRHHFF